MTLQSNNETRSSEHIQGWVSTPNWRGTEDIVWSCFFTIFVCTWTILHLNLPSAQENHWRIKLRKAKWMAATILVPEVVTASAFAQRVQSKQSVNAMELLECRPWSMTHAFYANMGGTWLKPVDSDAFPVNAAQLNYLIAEKIIEPLELTKREIWDRSKADKFAKLSCCIQIIWLFVQCMVRAAVHLPVTPLEIATLGFAIPSIATFGLWFDKPRDIETPTFFPIDMTLAQLLAKIAPKDYEWHDTPLDFIDKVNSPSFTSEIILRTSWWPGRDSFTGPAHRIRNDVFAMKYSIWNQLFVFAIWIGFAGTHYSAWTFSFPTSTETWAWRICCLAMTGSMFVFCITSNRKFYLLFGYLLPKKKRKFEQVAYERTRVSFVQIALGAVTATTYIISRTGLIVLSLMSLRSLPRSAFMTVSWTDVFPAFH